MPPRLQSLVQLRMGRYCSISQLCLLGPLNVLKISINLFPLKIKFSFCQDEEVCVGLKNIQQ